MRALTLMALLALVPLPAAAQPAPETPAAIPVELNPLADGRLGALKAVRERPLFVASRRSPQAPSAAPLAEVAAAPVPEAPPPAPDLRLVGIVAGDGTLAAVLKRSGGASLTLRPGESVDGWSVDAIGPERVVLRQGEREQTYALFAGKPLVTAVPAPPPSDNLDE